MFRIDKERYPRFYRLVTIVEQVVDGYIALVKEQRVAVTSYDDDFNMEVCYIAMRN